MDVCDPGRSRFVDSELAGCAIVIGALLWCDDSDGDGPRMLMAGTCSERQLCGVPGTEACASYRLPASDSVWTHDQKEVLNKGTDLGSFHAQSDGDCDILKPSSLCMGVFLPTDIIESAVNDASDWNTLGVYTVA